MTNLQDKTERQQLIQRFLDADISVEEEKALADFYQQTNETLSADEEPMKQLVLATTHLSNDFTLSAEKEEVFDRIMTATPQKVRHVVLWPWLAAACAVAIMMVLLAPPKSDAGDSFQQQEKRVNTPPKEHPGNVTMTDTAEMTPKTFLATRPSSTASSHLSDAEYDQSDLISVDSTFGIESRPDPLAEYTALNEKLKRECDAVFEMMENKHSNN